MPIDKGTSKPITQLSSLQINYKDQNSCFNPPIVTTKEREALVNTDDPKQPIKDGTLVFNSDTGYEEYYSQAKGGWIQIKENAGGGNVSGPDVAVDGNLVAFDGTSGKVIKDSGVSTNLVVSASSITVKKGQIPVWYNVAAGKINLANSGVTVDQIRQKRARKNVNATELYQISNLGALQFGSNENVADTGVILVDGLTPLTFQTQGTGADSRVCTVINGELGGGSSSPSALLEINSSEGGFLNARLTTAQRDSLLDPKDGLLIYNTDTKNLNLRQNNAWVDIGTGSTSSTILPTRLLSNSYYDATIDDCVIITQGGGGYTINLPNITDSIVGKLFIIIEGVGIGNTNNVIVQGKIQGVGPYVIKEKFGYVSLVAGRPTQGWSVISSSSNSASGNVIGPSVAINNNISVFDGTSGAIIKDSGFSSSFFRDNNFKNIIIYNNGTSAGTWFPKGTTSAKITILGSGGDGGKAANGYYGCGGGAGALLIVYLKNLDILTDSPSYYVSSGFLNSDGSNGIDAQFIVLSNYLSQEKEVQFVAANGITGLDGSSLVTAGGAGGKYKVNQIGSIYKPENYTYYGFNGANGNPATNNGISGAGAVGFFGGAGASVIGNSVGQDSQKSSGSGASGSSGNGLNGGKAGGGIVIIEY